MSESWRLEAVVFGGCGVVPAFVPVPSDSSEGLLSVAAAEASTGGPGAAAGAFVVRLMASAPIVGGAMSVPWGGGCARGPITSRMLG